MYYSEHKHVPIADSTEISRCNLNICPRQILQDSVLLHPFNLFVNIRIVKLFSPFVSVT
jgi:hypothetical protein